MKRCFLFRLAIVASLAAASTTLALPRPDHVVVVIMENHSYSQIIGSADAPNISALALEGANFVNSPIDPASVASGSHALRHPSQPNYLELFSGNNQGTLQDGHPGTSSEPLSSAPPFNTPNLAASLIAGGLTFVTYSENLPSVGFDGDDYTTNPALTQYQRKHNPVANWQAADAPANHHVPFAVNQPFTSFPTNAAGFTALPTVAFVVPDQQDDMHDGTVAQADAWLKTHILDTYYQWAKTHNSLLIVTFDEDGDNTPSNQIPTIFAGPMVKPGNYFEMNINPPDTRTPDGLITPTGTAMNHYNVLRTIEDIYGLAPIGGSANVPPISDVFVSIPTSGPVIVPNNLSTTQGDTGNLFPLFSSKPIRYQQVLAKSQFSRFAAGGETINSIAFRAHAPGVPFAASVPQLQVGLSTTQKNPDGLSSTFGDNVGPDDVQVFSGALNVAVNNPASSSGVATFDIVITFTTPFHYNPASGNLLIDIQNIQGGSEVPPLDQEMDATNATGDSVSRVYNYGDANATAAGQSGGTAENDTTGLVIQFGTTTNAAPSPTPTPSPNTMLLNDSTRLRTGSGDSVMIGGFIVGGSVKKKVVVRGIGPSIKINGTPVPGTLQDPVIELHKSDGSILSVNDNWKDTQQAEIEATGLAPADDRESAISIALDPGNYTVVLTGKDGASGIGLVEAYDVEQGSPARLLNISTRGQVQTGDNVMIGGVILGGSDYARVIFRGLGPSIAVGGVPVPGTLADPTLELHDGNGAPLAFDDNWKDSQQAEIQQSGLAPSDDREAAIIGSYPPGQYTAILRGKNDTTGIALVEAYKLN
ncbi:MAG TPA: alkaline phosphatase family protein [Chthoniobacterales bacterium]|nr:alkaline phosphatase family protein [Chthoniobacterales bacterium]